MQARISIIGVLLVALCFIGSAMAQGEDFELEEMERSMPSRVEHRKPGSKIPDLTEEQEEQMQTLRTDHLKAILPMRNELAEMNARLQTLSTADNVDMSQINGLIEKMGDLRIQMMKAGAAHRQEIRKLLTDKQRVVFDSHRPGPKKRPPRRR